MVFIVLLLLFCASLGLFAQSPQLTLNPDISVILDGLYSYGVGENTTTKKNETIDRFLLREIELGLQANVDPFARADVFLGFHSDEVEIEEAYGTMLTLPYGLGARLGLFRPAIGKLNLAHFPEIVTTNPPLVYESLLGGEEGISGAGVEVTQMLELPWYSQVRLAAMNIRREQASGKSLPSYLMHLKNFFEFSSESNLETGLSLGKRTVRVRDLLGADVTFRWRPEKLGMYRSLWIQNEFFLLPRIKGFRPRWGGFSVLQWQLDRRFYIGAKVEATQESDSQENEAEQAESLFVSCFPSEFSRYRLELRRKESDGGDETAVFLQATFSLGPHRPHAF